MAVNLCIDIPDWDHCAGGMKFIRRNDELFPYVVKDSPEPAHWNDIPDLFIRPSDFALWRKNIEEHIGLEGQWGRALDAMEADPDLWISVSE